MICPYCSQWNPDRDLRCCFCDNKVDSGEDATVKAQPKYAARAITIQKALPSSYDLPAATRRQRSHVKLQLTENQAIAFGASILIVILIIFSRC